MPFADQVRTVLEVSDELPVWISNASITLLYTPHAVTNGDASERAETSAEVIPELETLLAAGCSLPAKRSVAGLDPEHISPAFGELGAAYSLVSLLWHLPNATGPFAIIASSTRSKERGALVVVADQRCGCCLRNLNAVAPAF